MRLTMLVLFTICSCLLSSCNSDSWSKKEKKKFLSECQEEGGSKIYCDCFMQRTMEQYPIYEETENMSFEEAIELSQGCK